MLNYTLFIFMYFAMRFLGGILYIKIFTEFISPNIKDVSLQVPQMKKEELFVSC